MYRKSEEQIYFSPHRRSYQRYILESAATLMADNEIGQPSILRDLCARGAGVVTHYRLRENQGITIIIKAPSLFSSPVRREARVVWCEKIGEGLWHGGLDFGEDNKIILH